MRKGEPEEPRAGYAMTVGDYCTRLKERPAAETKSRIWRTVGDCYTQTQGKVRKRNIITGQNKNNSSHSKEMLIPLQSESSVTNTQE
jgi:hypothetical protein